MAEQTTPKFRDEDCLWVLVPEQLIDRIRREGLNGRFYGPFKSPHEEGHKTNPIFHIYTEHDMAAFMGAHRARWRGPTSIVPFDKRGSLLEEVKGFNEMFNLGCGQWILKSHVVAGLIDFAQLQKMPGEEYTPVST